MEENKVIIFEKKEIVLILLFVVVLIITSFTLGIRLGKKLSLDVSGIKEEDVKTVELKSTAEEDAEKAIEADAALNDEEKLKKLMDESKARLSDELEKFSSESSSTMNSSISTTNQSLQNSSTAAKTSGRFTIQLGSYNTMEEAKSFAEGFTVRGYDPIINEVKIDGKGNWFRVSLGIFNTVEDAKAYIKNEQSLFSGQDHIISEIR